jgi:crossover junction endodeoxyribonuclease RusA
MYAGKTKFLNAKAKAFVNEATILIKNGIQLQGWKTMPRGMTLYVDCAFYYKDKKIRDSHNTLKILMDVMEGYVYENDTDALPRIQDVIISKENPRVEIKVTIK